MLLACANPAGRTRECLALLRPVTLLRRTPGPALPPAIPLNYSRSPTSQKRMWVPTIAVAIAITTLAEGRSLLALLRRRDGGWNSIRTAMPHRYEQTP